MARLLYKLRASNIGRDAFNPASLRLQVTGGHSGNRFARVYKEGSAAPAFTNIGAAEANFDAVVQAGGAGRYIIDYQDDLGTTELGKVNIYTFANQCYTANSPRQDGSTTYFETYVAQIALRHLVAGLENNQVSGRSFSINGGVTWKSYTTVAGSPSPLYYTNAELSTLGYINRVPDVKIGKWVTTPSLVCITTPFENMLLDRIEYAPLEGTYTKTDCTAEGASDGTIVLDITGGSGSYSYLWNDGNVQQNRSNLDIGTYSVVVTDNVTLLTLELDNIVITEPQIPVIDEGTIFEFPLLNPLQFVVDPIVPDGVTNLQGVDNVLFKNQTYGRYQKTNYFQKVCIGDIRPIQFNSDFVDHILTLNDYNTDEIVKDLSLILKEENLGKSADYGIRIQNHTEPGQSRVYFQEGAFPIPVPINTVFEILNNVDGFNGVYAVVGVENDDLLGYPYMIITKVYVAPGSTSNATGRFSTATVPYNVYESFVDFSDVPVGDYYVKAIATNFLGEVTKTAFTEPICVKENQYGTVLIEYRHFINGFDIAWSTGFIGQLRVEGVFGHRRNVGGEHFSSRDADYSLQQTTAKLTRGLPFTIVAVPPYMHEKLACIFALNFKKINGVEVVASEAYPDADYGDLYLLADAEIKLEAKPMFKQIRNTGISSVAEGGFLLLESGFLKL